MTTMIQGVEIKNVAAFEEFKALVEENLNLVRTVYTLDDSNSCAKLFEILQTVLAVLNNDADPYAQVSSGVDVFNYIVEQYKTKCEEVKVKVQEQPKAKTKHVSELIDLSGHIGEGYEKLLGYKFVGFVQSYANGNKKVMISTSCSRCGGTGNVGYQYANGVCFKCGGSGSELRERVVMTKENRAKADAAAKRRAEAKAKRDAEKAEQEEAKREANRKRLDEEEAVREVQRKEQEKYYKEVVNKELYEFLKDYLAVNEEKFTPKFGYERDMWESLCYDVKHVDVKSVRWDRLNRYAELLAKYVGRSNSKAYKAVYNKFMELCGQD